MEKQQLAKARADLLALAPFMPKAETAALAYALKGEEGEAIGELIAQWRRVVDAMPRTYEQDGKGDDAIAYLHYFIRGSDWYISEKDVSGDGRDQAFGFACINGDIEMAELGYISIAELVDLGVELDLYWLPKTLGECKRSLLAKQEA